MTCKLKKKNVYLLRYWTNSWQLKNFDHKFFQFKNESRNLRLKTNYY